MFGPELSLWLRFVWQMVNRVVHTSMVSTRSFSLLDGVLRYYSADREGLMISLGS